MNTPISFNGKPSITEAWPLYKHHFRALAAVHELGRSKYSAFSWQNNPQASNSTIENNVDALMRHIALHKAGHVQDSEGFPHVYHIACRIGMLLTTWYRQMSWGSPIYDRPDTFPDCQDILATYIATNPTTIFSDQVDVWLPMLHITPEETIACLKMYLPNGTLLRRHIDTNIVKYQTNTASHYEIIYILDIMQLMLLTLVASSEEGYSDYLHIAETLKKIDAELIDKHRSRIVTAISPCDILQYLSAKLLTIVETSEDLKDLTRSNDDIRTIIANYKKKE